MFFSQLDNIIKYKSYHHHYFVFYGSATILFYMVLVKLHVLHKCSRGALHLYDRLKFWYVRNKIYIIICIQFLDPKGKGKKISKKQTNPQYIIFQQCSMATPVWSCLVLDTYETGMWDTRVPHIFVSMQAWQFPCNIVFQHFTTYKAYLALTDYNHSV